MTVSNAKRVWAALIGSVTGWAMLFLALGLPVFHLGFKTPIATIASFAGICCAAQLGIVGWLIYIRNKPSSPASWEVHSALATAVLFTTIGLLFFYFIRRSRPGDAATQQFTSIAYGVTVSFAALCLIMRIFSRRKGSSLDAHSTQTKIELVFLSYILAWFCFLFMAHEMSSPPRDVSQPVLVGFVFAAVCFLAAGFVMRKKLLAQSAETLPGDLVKSLSLWRGAHFIGFNNAISIAILGVALKFLGANWIVCGIFFGLSLGFLLLWRPRQLNATGAQPA
jgi:hypothetical protein